MTHKEFKSLVRELLLGGVITETGTVDSPFIKAAVEKRNGAIREAITVLDRSMIVHKDHLEERIDSAEDTTAIELLMHAVVLRRLVASVDTQAVDRELADAVNNVEARLFRRL